MRTPRITTRRLMAFVLVVAAVLALGRWVAEMRRTRADYLALAAQLAHWEAVYRKTARDWTAEVKRLESSAQPRDAARQRKLSNARRTSANASRTVRRLSWLKQVSQRLAARPWESLPPDQPW